MIQTNERMNEQTNEQMNEQVYYMSFDIAILPDDEDQRRNHNSHFQKCKTPKNQMNIFEEIHFDGNQSDNRENHLSM